MEAEEESEAKRGDAEGQENLKVLNTANASGKRYILEGIMHLLSLFYCCLSIKRIGTLMGLPAFNTYPPHFPSQNGKFGGKIESLHPQAVLCALQGNFDTAGMAHAVRA
jgi:hypothetical protein